MISAGASAFSERMWRHARRGAGVQAAYAWYLHAVYGRRGLPWDVNGERILIDPRARRFVPHENEVALFQFLRANIHPGATVVDVGAFVGVYAILEARWSGSAGRVLALEPFPASFDHLQRHLQMNGLDEPRVRARRVAAGARAGRRALIAFDDEPYRNMIAPTEGSLRRTTVDVVTLDEACAGLERAPDLIRMDVQGLEFDVLCGASNIIRAGRGRIVIVAEMHPDQWPGYGISCDEVPAILAGFGLRARPLVPGGDLFVQSAHVVLEYI